jgi:hypothetical protein
MSTPDTNESTEFSWEKNKADIAIDRVDAIAVYLNEAGNIVIRQEDPMDEDSFIVVPRSRVDDLIAALKREAGEE